MKTRPFPAGSDCQWMPKSGDKVRACEKYMPLSKTESRCVLVLMLDTNVPGQQRSNDGQQLTVSWVCLMSVVLLGIKHVHEGMEPLGYPGVDCH
jgi:hypothetical protein